jgi:CRP-like cAMP-binding protein
MSDVDAFRRVLAFPELRRVELSWGISKAALWGWVVTMNAIVVTLGGPWAVGVLVAVHIIPAALANPVLSVLAERWGSLRGLAIFGWVRAAALGATAVVLFVDGPLWALLAISVLEGLGSEPQDAVHFRALPWLARSADELTAANGLSEVLRMGGILVGPAVAMVLLRFTRPDIVITLCAATAMVSALLLRGLGDRVPPVATSEVGSTLQTLRQGLRYIVADREVLILVGVVAACGAVSAALQVYGAALSIDLLDLGTSGPSLLVALFGVGGLVGGVGSVALAGRRDLALPVIVSGWVIGAPIVVMGLWPNRPVTFTTYALCGTGVVLVLVAGATLMQRGTALALQPAIFGINALVGHAVFGLGGFIAGGLVAAAGLSVAIVVTGCFIVVVTTVSVPSFRRFAARSNAHAREVDIARRCSIFGVLPIGPLERVAAALERVDLAPDETAIRQGEAGEHCFIVGSGRVAVVIDGMHVKEIGPGGVFGEVALLEDVPRTATVVAREPSELYRLDRRNFLAALNASPETRHRATVLSNANREETARLSARSAPEAPAGS